MKQEEAEKRLAAHSEITYLILGIRSEDGNFRFDCAACISEDDYRKEVKKFHQHRLFTVKEIKQ